MNNDIIWLGNFLPTKTRDNPNQGRVYDSSGIAPCLTNPRGGGRTPHIIVEYDTDKTSDKGRFYRNV